MPILFAQIKEKLEKYKKGQCSFAELMQLRYRKTSWVGREENRLRFELNELEDKENFK